MTHTYRATVALEISITAVELLTEDDVQASAREIVQVHSGPGRRGVLGTVLRSDPAVSIEEAWCVAMTRRNSIDGQLYQCSMAPGTQIHGPVAVCSGLHGKLCENPAEHHDYVSPGWDSPFTPGSAAALKAVSR